MITGMLKKKDLLEYLDQACTSEVKGRAYDQIVCLVTVCYNCYKNSGDGPYPEEEL